MGFESRRRRKFVGFSFLFKNSKYLQLLDFFLPFLDFFLEEQLEGQRT